MCDLSWLPPLVMLEEAGGNVPSYYDLLYDLYLCDLVYHPPEFEGLKVETMVEPWKQEKEAGFWHILEGRNEENLDDSLRRHQRIRWIKPIIQAVGTDRVLMWKRPDKPDVTKPHIVLLDFSFIVILRQHPKYIKLITGFPVDRDRRRQDYRMEWEKYQAGI